MITVMRYGTERSVRLDLHNGNLLAECGTLRAAAVADPVAAVDAALADPLDYPPLARSTTPGDRVVLALEEGVPQGSQIADATIAHLLRCGMDLDGITILQGQADVAAGIEAARRLWPSAWKERIRVVTHDPADRRQMAYLAATESGEPVFLNRALTDADLVLSIGCLRREGAPGYHGIHSGLFPTFSHEKARLRYLTPDALRATAKQKRPLDEEVNEVAWLLGLTFTIQVVPAGGDRVLHVLAGQCGAVATRGRELYRQAWDCRVPGRASLVLAAIEGSAAQQTWQNLGRALAAALPLVEEGGAIALCSEVAAEPGRAIQYLAEIESRELALRVIRKARPADTLSALQLVEAQQRNQVYLLSGLDAALVEQLDMAPVDGPAELVRLVQRHPSCIVLANAPHVAATVDAE